MWTSVYDVPCTTTTLCCEQTLECPGYKLEVTANFYWANCLGYRMVEGDAWWYWTIYDKYIIYELAYLMLRYGLTRCDYC